MVDESKRHKDTNYAVKIVGCVDVGKSMMVEIILWQARVCGNSSRS